MSKTVRLAAIVLTLCTLFIPSIAGAAEDPTQFALKYYQAVAASKSPFDTKEFLSARVLAKQKDQGPKSGMDAAMMKMIMDMMAAQQPKKVKVVGSKLTPGKASLQLEAIEIPKHYRDMAKDATSWSLKGSLELVQENNTWKVDKDMWTFTSKGKNGSMNESSGIAGPSEDKINSGSALPKGFGSAPSAPTADFESQVRDKVMKSMRSWNQPAQGKDIYALINLAADGKIVGLKVRGETPQPGPEKLISDLLVTSQPFQPLPAKYQTQPNVWMMFDWSSDSRSISGPYFSAEPHPDWLRQKVGLN